MTTHERKDIMVIVGILAYVAIMWSLSGCSTINVPDVPICRPLRLKTETKVMPELGKVTLTRGNPLCKKMTGSDVCLVCVTMATGKETYVADDAAHLIEISGKRKSYSLIMHEGSILPVESLVELRQVFTNTCKQYGCTDKDIGKWQAKITRFSSIGEALK